jgi:membrane protein DedA with SNARE-associated domain
LDALLNTVAAWSWLVYFAIFFIMLIEGAGAPIPGLSVVLVAAALAGQGRLELWLVVLSNTAGWALGSHAGYWLGKNGGRPILYRWGKYVLLPPERIAQGEALMQKHGIKAVLFRAHLPVICFLGSVLAGIGQVNLRRFTIFNLISIGLWMCSNMLLAYFFGRNLDTLVQVTNNLGLAALGIFVILGVGYWLFKRRARAKTLHTTMPVVPTLVVDTKETHKENKEKETVAVE